jgi:beta-galactosidase
MLRGLAVLAFLASVSGAGAADHPGRERTLFDSGWRFALGHATDPAKDFGHATGFFSYLAKTGYGDGAAAAAFDDRGWRLLDLPHDWAVEVPFDPRGSHSHGYKAVGPRFPESSVGWYRKHFTIPESDLGRRIRLEFDGVYRAARVFVNGFFVGEEPSGTAAASYDVSDYLNYGGDNVVAVRVDASMEEGWYYEGAGIYRHTWLLKTDPVHIAQFGTWVRTEVADGGARLTVETVLANEGREPADVAIRHEVFDPAGRSVAQSTAPAVSPLAAGARSVREEVLTVSAPRLWSIETPHLYRLETSVLRAGRVVDRYSTPFGIRTIRFDPDRGFFLNGERVTIKGTNNHQDHAGIGVALPDAMQEFRLRALKAMGSNTYRTSHHPPTPELLDACDRLGMLVIDETRLQGINEFHLRQLEQMIRRDRNHPSVILWSLGNEEWAIEGNIKGARITTTMQDFAHRLDPTRRTTVAISGGWGGTSTTVEVAGVNYIKQARVDEQHRLFPQQIIVGTEETTTQGTRGVYVDDRTRCHLAPVEDGSSGGNAEIGWQFYAARPWAAGVVYWTGFDYRGEPVPFGWPAISSQFGILDTCGFPKDGFYYLKSWWSDETVLHLFPHWNWPGREGESIEVRAHSNCEEVELFLNDVSLGRQRMPINGHLAWPVRYAPGSLVARGCRGGREIAVARVETTGAAAALALTPDRATVTADGRDVAVITVDVRDAAGRIVPTAGQRATFAISGPGKIIGVGNGDPSSHEPDVFVESVSSLPLGAWTPPEAAVTEGLIVFEARFDRPTVAPGGAATLLLNALGPRQTVTLNGRELMRDAAPAQARAELALSDLALQSTGNVLRIEATRFAEWSQREAVRLVHPAAWRLVVPPAPWSRSVFNGLAQVIVQSTGGAGDIVVTAAADGLTPARAVVQARPASP